MQYYLNYEFFFPPLVVEKHLMDFAILFIKGNIINGY